jgi:hypothetical protein
MLKKILNKLTGKPTDWASQAIVRYPFIDPSENYHLQRVAHDILKKSGGEVFTGPLAGMKIPLSSPLSYYPLLVVGCYEKEIHDALYEVIANPPHLMIDIGSAFGYYTVGLACKTSNTRFIAFEAEEKVHWEKARELAELNKVAHRIDQLGYCDFKSLEKVADEGAFILCDCEGGEMSLLDPEKVPNLSKCHILCEIHEFLAPGVTAKLVDRFSKTHKIKLISEQARNPKEYRILDNLSEAYKELAVKETRFHDKKIVSGLFMNLIPL